MRIGDLNHRLTLQSPVSVSDGMGGFTTTWKTEAIVWGSLWPTSVTERIQANAPTMVISHRIRVRWKRDIGPDWRLKFDDRYFSIVGLINPNESNKYLEILAKEVTS